MRYRRKTVATGAAAIVGIWLLAWLGISWAGSLAPTPEKVVAYAGAQDLSTLTGAARARYLDGLADRVNALTFEQRRELAMNHELARVFDRMTEAERLEYLQRVLPRGFQRAMEALNNMSPADRQRLVALALKELRKAHRRAGHDEIDGAIDEQTLQRIIDAGLATYFSEASAETKINLQPLIEQMQAIMQRGRHHQRGPGGRRRMPDADQPIQKEED